MQKIRIGVLGAGHLGRIHIQQLLAIPQCTLVGVHDPDPARCQLVHDEFGVDVFPTPDALIGQVDGVDIVTPTITHHDLAMAALRAGKHVFIEKPIAHTIQQAQAMVQVAAETGRVVQVGHVERFNPAFQAVRSQLREPMFIETHRLAQFDPRGTDVSVVLDLMIHDIDIVLDVVQSPLVRVDASGVAVVSDTPDIANARLTFQNGCVANLTASRISLKKMRKSRFFQRDAYISVDMLEKAAEIVRIRPVDGEPDPFAITMDLGHGRGVKEIGFDKPAIPPTNAINAELESFILAIMHGTPPLVTAVQGAAALDVAHQVLASMRDHKRPDLT